MAFSQALNVGKKRVFEGKSKGKSVVEKGLRQKEDMDIECNEEAAPVAPDGKRRSEKVEVKREASAGSSLRGGFLLDIAALWQFSRDNLSMGGGRRKGPPEPRDEPPFVGRA